jgi:steroid delta-isomerase-like uncharacterized protein
MKTQTLNHPLTLFENSNHIFDMRTLFTMILFSFVITSYAQSTASSNKEAVRIYIEEAWNKKKVDKLESLLADSTIFHVNNFYSPSGNKETTTQSINDWHAAFPDFKYVISHIMSEGDFVSVSLQFTGTHKAKFADIDPLNNKVEVSEMILFRFKNNRIAEIWVVWDWATMKEQMLKKH